MSARIDRRLIVNADDFGQSEGINRGVLLAHAAGVVTSASLMVRCPAAIDAVRGARDHPGLGLGLHVDLGEWIYEDGVWRELHRSPVERDDPAAVEAEIVRQLGCFRRMVGSEPTHLDSHQHVHREEPVRSILTRMGRDLGVPLRGDDRTVRYLGTFYGQSGRGEPIPNAITVEALLSILAGLPAGVTELGCHPGSSADVRSMYARERSVELDVLLDPRIREAIDSGGIELISFRDLVSGERDARATSDDRSVTQPVISA